MRYLRHITFIVAASLLAACSGNPSLVTIEAPAALTSYKPQLQVDEVWARQVGAGVGRQYIKLAPLVQREYIYAADRHGVIDAFATADGKRVWRSDIHALINAGPGDGSDLLLFGGNAEVIAVRKSDGSIMWRTPLSSEVLSAPVRRGNVVVAHTVDGVLYGLDAGDGHQLWRYSQDVPLLSLRGVGEPQIEGNIVVAGFADGHVVALSVTDGSVIWDQVLAVPHGRTELERMDDVDGRLVVADGMVYAVSYQGRISAFSLDSGPLIWTRNFSSYTGIAASQNELYVTDSDGNVWALARSDGGTLWKQGALHGRELSAPALQGDAVIVADYQGYLHWLAREDGHLMARVRVKSWQEWYPVPSEYPSNGYQRDRAVMAAPRVVDAYVYAMDKEGVLNAFRVSPLQH